MKKIILLSFIALNAIVANAQAPNWLWARSAGPNAGGNYLSETNAVAVDVSGNVYVAGFFQSPIITFGSDTLKSPGSIFLVKYDKNGNVLWAKNSGGTGAATSIAVDASGNVYVAENLGYSTSYDSISFIKYAANGNVIWSTKKLGGTGGDIETTSIAVDALGNTYVSGYFYSAKFIFGSDTLNNCGVSYNYSSIFLAKYDYNGNALWAKNACSVGNDKATSVAVDTSDNVYLTGYFGGSSLIFFHFPHDSTVSTTLTNPGYNDIFLVKYDSNGKGQWAKSAGGTASGGLYYGWANSVAVDASGNLYVTGYFESSTFIFGSDTLTSLSYYNIFLAKYNIYGNGQWAKIIGGKSGVANSVAVDGLGNAYVTGQLDSLSSGSGYPTGKFIDMFLTKYDNNGNLLWTKSVSEKSIDVAASVAVDSSGNAYIAGYFDSPTLMFGSNILTNAESAGYDDIFLAKLGDTLTTNINYIASNYGIKLFPNPAINNLTIESPQSAVIEITNIQGQLIKTLIATGSKTSIDISAFPSGVYVVEMKTEKGVAVKKFVKV